YDKANLLNYVENLKGKKLLMVHGTSDPTVVFQLPLLYAQKAANLNVPLDFYPYIGHDHIIKGFDAVHLYEKITNYFLDNL
ncbi:MAG TPA: prolyl oligopeptidase family serine peptidase, partial [Ignavibacteriales bacterium]|nr:prolyl oligopeptidase family serine peptidase [Ignavibacteriales bacterium]